MVAAMAANQLDGPGSWSIQKRLEMLLPELRLDVYKALLPHHPIRLDTTRKSINALVPLTTAELT